MSADPIVEAQAMTLADVFGTDDPDKQIEIARRLVRPVFAVTLVYDERTGQIGMSSTGKQLSLYELKAILMQAWEQLVRVEVAHAQQQSKEATDE
jgi:hypothetical protein